jgi:hypothetical protein
MGHYSIECRLLDINKDSTEVAEKSNLKFSIIFSIYYLVATQQEEEMIRKFHISLTEEFLYLSKLNIRSLSSLEN